MKTTGRFPLILSLSLLLITAFTLKKNGEPAPAPVLSIEGFSFRDLNKNGKLDTYEDSRQAVQKRVDDLLSQMTLEEKAGTMFINGTLINTDGSIDKKPDAQGFAARIPAPADLINNKKMNHFNLWQTPGTRALAEGYNAIQKVAEASRLGIPVTIASDPRNHYQDEAIFSMSSNSFAGWCEPLGFAAIGDEKLVQQFADMSRQEYLAVGMRIALHPMADLASTPEDAAELYASRYFALRLMFESRYRGASPIADPDLAMVDPARFDAMSAPPLTGFSFPKDLLADLYFGAAKRLLTPFGGV